MADMTKIGELWARLGTAHARGQTRQAELRAEAGHSPAPGDVYLWPAPNDLGLSWVVVSDHTDDAALVYVVPADGHPLAGLADVIVRDAGAEPLYLRCGRWRWVRRAELPADRRYRVLDPHHMRRTQEKLRQIATGPLDGSSAAWEDEADPDYHAWIAEMTEAVLALSAPGHRPPVTLTDREFTPWTVKFRREQTAEPALAAAGNDPFAALIAPPTEDPVVSAAPLPFDGPGDLRVIRDDSGAALVFQAESATAPPAVAVADETGEWQRLVWDVISVRTARAVAPWIEGRVRLRIGIDGTAPEVIVTRP